MKLGLTQKDLGFLVGVHWVTVAGGWARLSACPVLLKTMVPNRYAESRPQFRRRATADRVKNVTEHRTLLVGRKSKGPREALKILDNCLPMGS